MPLRVIPVLDVKEGTAVRAVGGARAHYQPLRSDLHPGSNPLAMARAYRDKLGLRELYVADLDAIAGAEPDRALYGGLSGLGVAVWVDAGVRDAASLDPLLSSGVNTVLAGLETLRGPHALSEVVNVAGVDRVVFSLDLRGGVPLIPGDACWGTSDPETLARGVIELGVRRVLLLDLAHVGRGNGTGTLPLVERISACHPEAEIIVGGGVAGIGDLEHLERAGASAVLVGSALHDGRIGARELGGEP